MPYQQDRRSSLNTDLRESETHSYLCSGPELPPYASLRYRNTEREFLTFIEAGDVILRQCFRQQVAVMTDSLS